MRLFEGVQKLTTTGTRFKVSVPVSKSIILSNKTKADILIYPNQSAKIGFPLKPREDLEIGDLEIEAEFYALIEATDLEPNDGLYLISQTDMTKPEGKTLVVQKEGDKISKNTVVINK